MAHRRDLRGWDDRRDERDRSRKDRLDRDVQATLGILADVIEAVELVSVANPPPDPDRRCIVCGRFDCACEQPGREAGTRTGRPADPTHAAWVRIEEAVTRAQRRYVDVLRAVEEVAGQFGLDFDDQLDPIAARIDPVCPDCGPDDRPEDCTHDSGRAAWLRPADPERPGVSSVTVAFRDAQTAIHGCLDEVQDVWLTALEEGESETTLQWTARSVAKLRTAAQKVLDALVAPAHPAAGKRPPPCRCEGENCSHWPGECDNLPAGRTKCSTCRSRDHRAALEQEQAS